MRHFYPSQCFEHPCLQHPLCCCLSVKVNRLESWSSSKLLISFHDLQNLLSNLISCPLLWNEQLKNVDCTKVTHFWGFCLIYCTSNQKIALPRRYLLAERHINKNLIDSVINGENICSDPAFIPEIKSDLHKPLKWYS